MKILLVNDYREKIAGAEIYIYNIMDELTKQGHEVKLFTSSVTSEQYHKKIENISLTDYINRLFNISSYTSIKRFVKKFSPDIIHVHGIFNELSPSILLAMKKYPIVMTIHNTQIVSPLPISISKDGVPCKDEVCDGCRNCVGAKGATYELLKRNIHKLFLKYVDLYITPSLYMKKVLHDKGFRNVKQLYNGINLLEPFALPNNKHILYVGRLTYEKGVQHIIQSIPLIKDRLPDVQLTILGDGKDALQFKQLVKDLEVERNVSFVGNVMHDTIVTYYKKTDVVCIPSVYPDNLPTVAIEAMSVGRPIVGSNIGGIPELIQNGKTGYLFTPGDKDDLANKMINLLTDKVLLLNMSHASTKFAEIFSMEKHVSELEKNYKATINKQ